MAKNVLPLLLFGIVIVMVVSLIPANSPNAVSFALSSPESIPPVSNHNVLIVTAGDTVTWHNNDNTNHTITSGTPGNEDEKFLSKEILPDQVARHTFNEPGTFPYFCELHPDKTGEIIVQPKKNEGIPPATLTVIKIVVNNNGGTNVPGDFTMTITAANPSDNNFAGYISPGTTVTIDPGEYSVDETGPGGYTSTMSAECTGTAVAGESYTCTVTNDDMEPNPLIDLFEDSDQDKIPDMLDQCPEDPESENSAVFDGCPDDDCQDPDGDGLCTTYEELIKTNSTNPDTDGDSLSDGVEKLYLGTEPTDPNDGCSPTTVEFDISLERISKMDKDAGTFTAKLGIETVTRHGNSSYDLTADEPDFDFENEAGEIAQTSLKQFAEKWKFKGVYEGEFFGDFDYSRYPLERFSFPIIIETPGKDECALKYDFSGDADYNGNNSGPLGVSLFNFTNKTSSQGLLEINYEEEKNILNKILSETKDLTEEPIAVADLVLLPFKDEYTDQVKQHRLEISIDGKGDDGFGIIKNIFPIMLMTSLAVIVFWLPKDYMTKIELNALFLISAVLFTQIIQFESTFVTTFTMYDVVIFSSYLIFLLSIAFPVIQLRFEQSGQAPEKISRANSIGRAVMVIAIILSIAISAAGYAGLYQF